MSIDTTLVGTRYFAGVGVRVVKRLDGVDSENYFVEAGGRKYVLKWYAAADPKSLGEELAAMQWLRGRGVPVPAVVPDRAGGLLAEVDGARAVLLEFIEGDAPGDDFATGLQIAALLDFSEAHRAPLIFDLAVLLGYWAFDADRGRLDLGKCRQLLTAYAATRPIPPAEMVLLPHAVLVYFATDATSYILPRLRDQGAFAISQCNMYRRFCAMRQERGWIDELSGVF